MTENIEQMRERHEQEIEQLQTNCNHKDISKCMPYQWAPGHISHCVIICENCGKELFTTLIKKYTNEFNPIRPDNYFECHKRVDCRYWERSE